MNGRKALIYEDDESTIDLIEAVLNGLGVESVMGPDPALILETARDVNPDIIILAADIKHGFSACLKLKKDKDLKRIPLFMIPGRTPADVITKHQKLPTRADVYLPTPLSSAVLTGILCEQLPALPSEPDPAPVPAEKRNGNGNGNGERAEIAVDDLPDHTIVSSRSFEASVVNFVEDEVKDLKATVARLQAEKDELHGKIGDMESVLRNQTQVLDSGFRAIREQQENIARSTVSEVSKVQEINRMVDEAVKEAVAATIRDADAASAGARAGLEEELAAARVRIDELREAADESSRQRKQINKLEKALEDAKRRQSAIAGDAAARESAIRREMDDTTALFGRLETGYKETIGALEEERDSLLERISDAENEGEQMRSEIRGYKAMADKFPALQEAAARNEVLTEENRKLRENLERVEAQVAALESYEQAARDLNLEVGKLRKSEAAVRDELADIRTKFNQVRSLLGLPKLEGEAGPESDAAADKGRSE